MLSSQFTVHSSQSPGEHLIGLHESSSEAIVAALCAVPVAPNDVFIDLGSGLGRVVMTARAVTGAIARGIEIQPDLVERSRAEAALLGIDVTFICSDAREADLEDGTVFYLYNPFTGPALTSVMERLHAVAANHRIVVCTLGVDLERVAPWLKRRPSDAFWLAVYDSICEGQRAVVIAAAP